MVVSKVYSAQGFLLMEFLVSCALLASLITALGWYWHDIARTNRTTLKTLKALGIAQNALATRLIGDNFESAIHQEQEYLITLSQEKVDWQPAEFSLLPKATLTKIRVKVGWQEFDKTVFPIELEAVVVDG